MAKRSTDEDDETARRSAGALARGIPAGTAVADCQQRTARAAGRYRRFASIEYSVEHLNTPLCVVLGHTHCGAVNAVVENEPEPEEVRHLITHIGEARL